MDNHYHLLVENTLENLSLGMRQLNSSYAKYFNKKYNRVGHLFTLFKYIESNPVDAKMTKRIGEYKYSLSFKILNNLLDECTNKSFVFTWYDIKEFSYLIEQKLTKKELENIDKIHKAKIEIKDNKLVEKLQNKTLQEYFPKLKSLSKIERNDKVVEAYEDGYTQINIAKYLGISNVAVSKIMKRLKVKASPFNTFWV